VLQERDRIGMDLHDGIIQSIYAVGLRLEGAHEDVAADPGAARADIDRAIEELNDVIRDVRAYIFELRPAHLSDDLAGSLRALADEFRVNSLIETSVSMPEAMPALDDEQQLAIFHIAQEALINARKHANASQVALRLFANARTVTLEVSDNGSGFDVATEQGDEHRGLRNMVARARGAGGELQVGSGQRDGTVVRATFPLGVTGSSEGAG
jgi:signal transduction histidine kinase